MLDVYKNIRNTSPDFWREDAIAVVAAGEKPAQELSSRTSNRAWSALTISPSLLDPAIQHIEDSEKRFVSVINDIRYTPAQRDQEAAIAQAEICSTLQLIRDHNDDELPDRQLDRIWKSYQCEGYWLNKQADSED